MFMKSDANLVTVLAVKTCLKQWPLSSLFSKVINWLHSSVTGPAVRSSFQVQGEAGDCQGETLTLE